MRIPIIALAASLTCGGCAISPDGAETQASAPVPENGQTAEGPDESATSNLKTWLGEQCPDGAKVRVTNTQTQESIDLTCEEIRAHILAATPLVPLDHAPPNMSSTGPEHVGEAPQGWSPAGVVCSILMAAIASSFNWPWGHQGCNDPRANNPDACKVTTGVVPVAAGVACAFL